MRYKLHIIASCTSRKRHLVPSAMCLRAARGKDVEARAKSWLALRKAGARTVLARELYSGEHWARVKDLVSLSRENGYDPVLWVASAGYGLSGATSLISPYSATFAVGDADSVWRRGDAVTPHQATRAWWSTVSRSRSPIASLVRDDPECALIVLGSAPYVEAMRPDLEEALERLNHKQRMLIITKPSSLRPTALDSNVVRSDTRLRGALGLRGNLTSLHARVAIRVIESVAGPDEWADFRSDLDSKRVNRKQDRRLQRTQRTDAQVLAFIGARLRAEVDASATRLLRVFRGKGYACEQARFQRLVRLARKERPRK